jgi:hypothetical protein
VVFSLSAAHLLFESSVSAGQTITETGADALTLKEAQSFAATISGFGTGDTIDAGNFQRRTISSRILRTRRHAHPDRRKSDRQYPDDRRLFEVEFRPRPRQRERHAGDVRLSRRPSRDPLREWCGNEGKGRERREHINMDGRPKDCGDGILRESFSGPHRFAIQTVTNIHDRCCRKSSNHDSSLSARPSASLTPSSDRGGPTRSCSPSTKYALVNVTVERK